MLGDENNIYREYIRSIKKPILKQITPIDPEK
jgi:hypothetical protein